MAARQQSGSGARGTGGSSSKILDASALLSHAQMLESKLQREDIHHSSQSFGHPAHPEIYMCRVLAPDKRGYLGDDLGIVAVMAVTNHCISAQLLKEEKSSVTPVGAPVEVLVLSGEDKITCATILSLELHHLSASDPIIVPERSQSDPDAPAMSLMSGGVKAIAPSPRVAVVVGTAHSRVISIEFSVKPLSMQLVRRNFFKGKEVCTYLEPLPSDTLTESQSKRGSAAPRQIKKQSSSRVSDVSSASDYHHEKMNTKPLVPFNASGGVTTIRPYSITKDGKQVTHVWISFGDGTGIRFHHAGLFPSVIQKHTEEIQKGNYESQKSLEEILDDKLVKWQTKLPPMGDDEPKVTIIPSPKYHPSPFAPFPTWKKPEFDEIVDPTVDPRSDFKEFHEAILYCTGAMAASFPTIAFYTSENQFEGRIHADDEEIEEKKSDGVVSAIIGGLWGAIIGSSGEGATTSGENPNEAANGDQTLSIDEPDRWDPNVPFPSMNYEPIALFAGCEIHDHPRQITSCTIDPDGDLAAATDTLGRVSLLDLSTKHIVRMWKGYRDTTCCWIQTPQIGDAFKEKPMSKRKTLYLVIHSRQRKVIEIWKSPRRGPKIKTIQVSREAQVISCRELSEVGFVASCFLAHSNVPFSPNNQMERIVVKEEDELAGNDHYAGETNRLYLQRSEFSKPFQDAAARLNRLQQLLGETNVACQTIDVFKALENIKSIEDLAKALDLLAESPTLEQKMGVEGATFQQLAISHCKGKLDSAMQEAGDKAYTNPHVQLLAFKIAYYTQIVKAYDVLHKYETGETGGDSHTKDVASPSGWGLEAIGWTSTYEKITRRSIDDDVVVHPSDSMKFSSFASACVPPKKWMDAVFDDEAGGYEVFLSNSSKTRKEVLVRIFRPLLGDVFSFNAVNQIFEALGIRKRHDYILKCFGEWFTTLSVRDISKKVVFAKASPTNRWLQNIVKEQMDSGTEKVPMASLYDFCRGAEELLRSFWLAILCRQSVAEVAAEKEKKTYGKVLCEEIVGRWDELLRQLRVCLLVSLRLHGIQLGACPLSIQAVDKGVDFSVFEWLARDELSMSSKHDEIVTLENACRISSHAFDPSTPEGDDPARIQILQKACLSAAISEEQRSEFLVDFDDGERLGALLLYLKPYNQADVLVAHRALLLASRWGREPYQLDLLTDAVVALQAIDVNEYKRLAYAVTIEVFQISMRPVFRALIMGFHDVQEIREEIYGPLFDDPVWMSKFSAMALAVLQMTSDFHWDDNEKLDEFDSMVDVDGSSTWPVLTECILLQRLVQKSRRVSDSAREAHQMLVYSLRISRDIATLSGCIPSFYDLFTTGALFHRTLASDEMEERQHEFMQDRVLAYALEYTGPSMDTLNLGDIEVLAELWEFDMDNVRTLFLLSMYEFGKDRFVDELVTKSASAISVQHFCEDGVEIVCRRLNFLLHVNPSDEIRQIMGSLDADMCEWIREKAENSEALVEGILDVPVGNTHLFGLRLLSLAANAEISKDDRIKIHSLIVLSGTIVKTLDEALSPGPDAAIPERLLGSNSVSTRSGGSDEFERSMSGRMSERDTGADDVMQGSSVMDLGAAASDENASTEAGDIASNPGLLVDGASSTSNNGGDSDDSYGYDANRKPSPLPPPMDDDDSGDISPEEGYV